MNTRRNHGARAALLSLEADAASARSGFACLFSTSDEYERAIISERRAQGRYDPEAYRVAFGILLAAQAAAAAWLLTARTRS